MKRTLSLKRETLTELTGPELSSVVGGTHVTCNASDNCTHGGSIDQSCPTLPVATCIVLVSVRCPTVLNVTTCIATG